jgi:hypothetical protein
MNIILGKIIVIFFLILIDVFFGYWFKFNYNLLNNVKFTSKYSFINRINYIITNYEKHQDIMHYMMFNIFIFLLIIQIIKQPSKDETTTESTNEINNSSVPVYKY